MVNIKMNNDNNINEEDYEEMITFPDEDYDNDNNLLSLYEKQKLYFFMFRMVCECISGILILLSMLIIIIIWFFWMIKNFKLN